METKLDSKHIRGKYLSFLLIAMLVYLLAGWYGVVSDIHNNSRHYSKALTIEQIGGNPDFNVIYYPDVPTPGSTVTVYFENVTGERFAPEGFNLTYLEEDNKPHQAVYEKINDSYQFVYPGHSVTVGTELGYFYVPQLQWSNALSYFLTILSPFSELVALLLAVGAVYFWFNPPIDLNKLFKRFRKKRK